MHRASSQLVKSSMIWWSSVRRSLLSVLVLPEGEGGAMVVFLCWGGWSGFKIVGLVMGWVEMRRGGMIWAIFIAISSVETFLISHFRISFENLQYVVLAPATAFRTP